MGVNWILIDVYSPAVSRMRRYIFPPTSPTNDVGSSAYLHDVAAQVAFETKP
jgi:hypothetical protein